MRRLSGWLSLAVLVVALQAGAAQACLWDRDTLSSEREFKSQYQPAAPQPATPASPATPILPIAATGAGVALLLGAVGLTLFRASSPR
jgi:hypothetical protein